MGNNVEKNPAIIRRIKAEGHILVNHFYSHAFPLFLSEQKLLEEIDGDDILIGKPLVKKGTS